MQARTGTAEWRDTPAGRAFTRFAQLTRQKRALVDTLRAIEAEIGLLEFELRDYLSSGLEKVTVDGLTIHLRRQIFVRHKEDASAAEVIEALKRNEMGHFVKEQYIVASLSAHVRQLEAIHQDELDEGTIESVACYLPRDVAAVLNIDPTYQVVALDTGKEKKAKKSEDDFE